MATGATHEQQGRDLHQTTRCEAETEWRRTALSVKKREKERQLKRHAVAAATAAANDNNNNTSS